MVGWMKSDTDLEVSPENPSQNTAVLRPDSGVLGKSSVAEQRGMEGRRPDGIGDRVLGFLDRTGRAEPPRVQEFPRIAAFRGAFKRHTPVYFLNFAKNIMRLS